MAMPKAAKTAAVALGCAGLSVVAPARDFTRRVEELNWLRDKLKGGMSISGMHGMGGVGKTALALKLADELRSEYPDAQFFLDLKGTDPQPLSPVRAIGRVARRRNRNMAEPGRNAKVGAFPNYAKFPITKGQDQTMPRNRASFVHDFRRKGLNAVPASPGAQHITSAVAQLSADCLPLELPCPAGRADS